MNRLRVVYVVGKGRSGSTLLDDVLGSLTGVTSLGEVRRLWDRLDEPEYVCTCGESLRGCTQWGPAITAVVGDSRGATDAVRERQTRVHSWRAAPALLAGARPAAAVQLAAELGSMYRAVADVSGTDTLVDSSKWPAHVGLLGMIPDVEPWVLHLVRDPRAVAYSYTKVKSGTGSLQMPRFGPAHSSLSWVARNITAELALRRVPPAHGRRLRYEDLAATPRETVSELADWLGATGAADSFIGEDTLHLGPAHLVGGNPRRFDRGDVAIRPDVAWRDRAAARDTKLVGALTAPLRRRYGYGNP